MSDLEPISLPAASRGRCTPTPIGGFPAPPSPPPALTGTNSITFSRLRRKVAAGEWRDYAVDFDRDRAVFSVYRRASEHALYRIEKCPKLARKQGAYSVVTATGLVLGRGPDLKRVWSILEKPVRLVDY